MRNVLNKFNMLSLLITEESVLAMAIQANAVEVKLLIILKIYIYIYICSLTYVVICLESHDCRLVWCKPGWGSRSGRNSLDLQGPTAKFISNLF